MSCLLFLFEFFFVFRLVNSPCPAIHLTPLMSGVLGKNLDCVQELLSIGASIIQLDMDGNSAYHYAVTSCPLAISVSPGYCLMSFTVGVCKIFLPVDACLLAVICQARLTAVLFGKRCYCTAASAFFCWLFYIYVAVITLICCTAFLISRFI